MFYFFVQITIFYLNNVVLLIQFKTFSGHLEDIIIVITIIIE